MQTKLNKKAMNGMKKIKQKYWIKCKNYLFVNVVQKLIMEENLSIIKV